MNALPPPPRRSAPAELEQRIQAELAGAPDHRFRPRLVVIPLVAASLVGVLALGVPQVVERLDRGPEIAASPTPLPTPTPTATPTPSSPPAPTPPPELGIRAMTKAEIAKDLKSCTTPPKGGEAMPQAGEYAVLWAQIQRPAGVSRPVRERQRVLVAQDDAGVLTCRNGSMDLWSGGRLQGGEPTARTPVVALDTGSLSSECGSDPDQWRTGGIDLYRVSDEVAYARVRFLRGKQAGVWQLIRPQDGRTVFGYAAIGREADVSSLTVQAQFFDDRGERVGIRLQGSGSDRVLTVRTEWAPCDRMEHSKPTPVVRPASDKAGVRRCLALGKAAAGNREEPFGSGWKSVLTVSTDDEWGAVLSNGEQRFGCSLFPTAEISALTADTRSAAEKAFRFALNPIPAEDGQSLWAAGRLPADVRSVLYRLPDGVFRYAKQNEAGYWMLVAHSSGSFGGSDDLKTWDPVRVTVVTKDDVPTTYEIGYTDQTMCNQISHGC